MNSSTYLHQYILWWYVVSTKDYAKKLPLYYPIGVKTTTNPNLPAYTISSKSSLFPLSAHGGLTTNLF